MAAFCRCEHHSVFLVQEPSGLLWQPHCFERREDIAPIFTIRSASLALVFLAKMRLLLFTRETVLYCQAWVILLSLGEDNWIHLTLWKQFTVCRLRGWRRKGLIMVLQWHAQISRTLLCHDWSDLESNIYRWFSNKHPTGLICHCIYIKVTSKLCTSRRCLGNMILMIKENVLPGCQWPWNKLLEGSLTLSLQSGHAEHCNKSHGPVGSQVKSLLKLWKEAVAVETNLHYSHLPLESHSKNCVQRDPIERVMKMQSIWLEAKIWRAELVFCY